MEVSKDECPGVSPDERGYFCVGPANGQLLIVWRSFYTKDAAGLQTVLAVYSTESILTHCDAAHVELHF